MCFCSSSHMPAPFKLFSCELYLKHLIINLSYVTLVYQIKLPLSLFLILKNNVLKKADKLPAFFIQTSLWFCNTKGQTAAAPIFFNFSLILAACISFLAKAIIQPPSPPPVNLAPKAPSFLAE